jgi:flagellar basal-body rod modification protein FlgD
MVTGVTGSSGTGSNSSNSSTSKAMNSSDFVNIMIKELQQQDPFDPVSSKDLVSQMGQIQSIQSNLTLTQTLSDLAISQKLSAAGNLIGKKITGLNTDLKNTTGTVTSVSREGNNVYLKLDTGESVSISSVTGIVNSSTTTTTTN